MPRRIAAFPCGLQALSWPSALPLVGRQAAWCQAPLPWIPCRPRHSWRAPATARDATRRCTSPALSTPHRPAATMDWVKKPYNTDASAAVAPFLSEPWCADILTAPGVTVELPASRYRKATKEDELFAHTLNKHDGLSGHVLIYKTPQTPQDAVKEIAVLFRLGSGLNGFPGVAHGGIVAALLDEATGALIVLNMLRGVWPKIQAMTAYLNTTFLKPVPTDAIVLCRARVDKFEGRKVFLTAEIEDADGNALARGEALYVYRKKAKL